MSDAQVPAIIEAWVRQLLDPAFVNLIRTLPVERIDVRLSASRGKVSKVPQITLNGGVQEMVQP